jgi:phytoene dehydrogenase-like protein
VSLDHIETKPGDPVPGTSTGQRAVVVGSGFGGLAMAIRLQAAGLRVTLLEKREKIGGRAYQLVDRGYVFDMGPSLITAPTSSTRSSRPPAGSCRTTWS